MKKFLLSSVVIISLVDGCLADDSRIVPDFNILIADIGSYFTSHNNTFSNTISSMTNVKLINENGLSGEIGTSDGVGCIKIELFKRDEKIKKPAFAKFSPMNTNNQVCESALKKLKQYLEGTFTYMDANNKEQTSGVGELPFEVVI